VMMSPLLLDIQKSTLVLVNLGEYLRAGSGAEQGYGITGTVDIFPLIERASGFKTYATTLTTLQRLRSIIIKALKSSSPSFTRPALTGLPGSMYLDLYN